MRLPSNHENIVSDSDTNTNSEVFANNDIGVKNVVDKFVIVFPVDFLINQTSGGGMSAKYAE